MTKAFPKHCGGVSYCMSGVRDYFEKHGWDFADFVANGIDTKILRETNDLMAIKLAEIAEGE